MLKLACAQALTLQESQVTFFIITPAPPPLSNLLWARQCLRLKYSHETKPPRLLCTVILESGVSVIATSPKYHRHRDPKTKKPQPCLEPMSLDMEDSRQKEEIIEKYMEAVLPWSLWTKAECDVQWCSLSAQTLKE